MNIFKTDEQRANEAAERARKERDESDRRFRESEREQEQLYATYPNDKDPRRWGIHNYSAQSQNTMLLCAILDVLYEIRDEIRSR